MFNSRIVVNNSQEQSRKSVIPWAGVVIISHFNLHFIREQYEGNQSRLHSPDDNCFQYECHQRQSWLELVSRDSKGKTAIRKLLRRQWRILLGRIRGCMVYRSVLEGKHSAKVSLWTLLDRLHPQCNNSWGRPVTFEYIPTKCGEINQGDTLSVLQAPGVVIEVDTGTQGGKIHALKQVRTYWHYFL